LYHSRHRTDPYDKEIHNALRDGNPRNFHQIPGEVTFSHNTLRLHLDSMIDDGLRIREKTPSKRRWETRIRLSRIRGGPDFCPLELWRGDRAGIRRFEVSLSPPEGSRCRETRGRCEPGHRPQIRKKD